MSSYITSSLWEHSPHKGSDLLLLLAMGDQAADDGQCWIAVDSLVRATRLDRRTVQRRLGALEETGAISAVPSGASGALRGGYQVNVPGPTQ